MHINVIAPSQSLQSIDDLSIVRRITDHLTDMAFVMHIGTGEFRFINQQMESAFATTVDTINNNPIDFFRRLIHPDDYHQRMIDIHCCRGLKDDQYATTRSRVRNARNEWRWHEIRDIPFKRDPSGEVCEIISICHDIHEQGTHPPGNNAMATTAFSQQSLIHEIRNPLTAIKIATQLLDEMPATASFNQSFVQKLIGVISRNVQRIEKDLQKLLYPCHTSSPRQRVQLSDIVESAIWKSYDRIFLKKIGIERSYNGTVHIEADVEVLTTAFVNIIVNAVEAIRHSNGTLWFSIHNAGDTAIAIVRDNGDGMDTMRLANIFTPHNSKTDGRGFGLSHVKEIIDEHGASIDVSSEPGTGTLFTMKFKTVK